MTASRTVTVMRANLTDRLVYLADGRTWPITNFLSGPDEIDSHEGATSFVAGEGDEWISEDMRDYQPSVSQ